MGEHKRPRPPKLGSLPRKVAKTDYSGSRGKGRGKAVPSRGVPTTRKIDLDALHEATYGGDGQPPSQAALDQLRSIQAAEAHVDTLKGKRGKDDFWYYMHNIWAPAHPGYSKLMDPVHVKIARHFQDMVMEWEWLREAHARGEVEGYVVRYAQEVFRGGGKSLIWTIAGSSWVSVRNPDAALVIDTRTEALGIAFLQPIANIMRGVDQSSKFTEFYGNWYASNRVWDKTQFVHAKRKNMAQIEPSYDLSATNISQTSRHPDGVFTDDPINETDVSENALDAPKRHMRSWPNIIRVPGFHAYSGTPYARDDVIHDMKERESGTERGSWQWIRLPALEKDKHGKEVSVAPSIRPTEWLLQKRKEDPVNFAAQFMLSPGEGEHQILTLQQMMELELNAVDIPTAGVTTIHADCAWADERSTAKGDSTVIAVAWTTPNFTVITDLWVEQYAKMDDYFEALTGIARKMGTGPRQPMLLTMDAEIGGYGGSVRRLHEIEFANRGLWLPPIEFVNRAHQGAKTRRIMLAAGAMRRGRIRYLRSLPHKDEFQYQYTHIGSSGHDDVADAVSDVMHPKVQRLQVFGRAASLYDENPDAMIYDDAGVPPLPSQVYGDNPVPVTAADDLSLEAPRHDPQFIDEVIRELMADDPHGD